MYVPATSSPPLRVVQRHCCGGGGAHSQQKHREARAKLQKTRKRHEQSHTNRRHTLAPEPIHTKKKKKTGSQLLGYPATKAHSDTPRQSSALQRTCTVVRKDRALTRTRCLSPTPPALARRTPTRTRYRTSFRYHCCRRSPHSARHRWGRCSSASSRARLRCSRPARAW